MHNYLLRHYLATLSYRTTLAIQKAPSEYPNLEIGKNVRKPLEILNHITFLMAYVISCYKEYNIDEYRNIHSWETEIERFYDTLEELDQILREDVLPLNRSEEQLLQGPIADAMTHVGQLTLLRRLVNAIIPYENYMEADIVIGQIRPKS